MPGLAQRLKYLQQAFSFSSRQNPLRIEDGAAWWPVMGSSTLYQEREYIENFMNVPELNAVINRKARMWSRMNIRIVSKTTGEDVKNYEYLVKVLRNPNWYQAQREFLMQTKLFREIHGNEYLYFNKGVAMPFRAVKSLYTLPPANVITSTPQDKPFFMYSEPVVSYKFKWGNDTYDLDPTSVIQFNDNRVNMTKQNWITGQSKMEALKGPINNIIGAYESRNMIIRYRGAAGFISPDAKDLAGVLDLSDDEKKAMQDAWSRYGTTMGQWQMAFSPRPVKFVAVGQNDPNKLGLFAEIEADFQKICDSYGMDRDLFGNDKGATWENKKQGERQTWNNTIIPEALEWIDGMNDAFNTGPESWKIVGDFFDIPVLQENIQEKGQAVQQIANALTLALNARACSPEDYQREMNKLGFELTDLPKDKEDGDDTR